MAWFSGKVSLGNFPDFSEAVNKLSESVKNIEKNFDSALGLEDKSDATGSGTEAPGIWSSGTDRKALFEPIIGFMGQKGGEDGSVESLEKSNNASKPTSPVKDNKQVENENLANQESEQIPHAEQTNEDLNSANVETRESAAAVDLSDAEVEQKPEEFVPVEEVPEQKPDDVEKAESENDLKEDERSEEILPSFPESVQSESTHLESLQPESTTTSHVGQIEIIPPVPTKDDATSLPEILDEKNADKEDGKENFPTQDESKESSESEESPEKTRDVEDNSKDRLSVLQYKDVEASKEALDVVNPLNDTVAKPTEQTQHTEKDINKKEEHISTGSNVPDTADYVAELEKVKKDMKMMETALQGAARQAQAKADEIAKLMNENEQLKSLIDDLRRKTNEAEIESLREEYHQRVAALERKVYALTRERDTLRREQNKKSDAAALLKEKDEIITQVMAEGEELSKKQAAQESQIRKLRAQIRELEEEKKGLLSKLQVEENKVESLKRDKAATEKLLQETVEKHQAELATQKEYYTNALNAAKEAEALAEARANTEARTELESRLREAEDRESMLVQTLEELRQTLSRKEQQAVFREDMLHKDIEDLQRRYQASERRCEELITQVPESTRPLLRQIEAMQETAARRAEAWTAVERSLNSRLQISCLRAEQTQLTRSLEKERQRAAENRQEYLALKEEADTHEGRVNQLEEEIRQLRRKHKEELHEALAHQELLRKELEREKSARLDQERASSLQSPRITDQGSIGRQKSTGFENGSLTRKISSASSLSSMEESYFLQTTLGSSDNMSERRSFAEGPVSPYYMKSMTSNTYEAALRQKDGELASYTSRLASLESIRDSLAEELVKMTAECEKLRAEAATLPGIRSELEALRRRHSAALELMGERDEELEELRADIVDLKEMYREQVNMLVNKIQRLSSSVSVA
ncbi:golgin candidate 5 [Phtheirospermum japonicum]|uniref:Golgin candidate 5 n=1 Tax=Phtheirospermum japonicum TaxID=374723 RepID=A0A830D5D0_9LAMI|nr:golgin candidate 5 [Phtheirospermum japonicum]